MVNKLADQEAQHRFISVKCGGLKTAEDPVRIRSLYFRPLLYDLLAACMCSRPYVHQQSLMKDAQPPGIGVGYYQSAYFL